MLTYNHMVASSDEREEAVSRLFHALSDPTRRDIVARALEDERSVSALARGYPISLAAVQKHVAVLVRAELVTKHRPRDASRSFASRPKRCGAHTTRSTVSK